MKRKGSFAKGCSIWLVCVIVMELLMLLFIPGCGLFQLSAINFFSGNAVKSFLPSYFPPPVTASQNPSAFASQGILYTSSSPYSYAIRMSDGRMLQKTEDTFMAADGGVYYTTTSDAPNTLLAVRVLDGTLLANTSDTLNRYAPPGSQFRLLGASDELVFIQQSLLSLSRTDIIALSQVHGNITWQRNITMAHTIGMNTPVPQNAPYITVSNPPAALLDSSTLYLTYSVLVTNGPPPAHFVISIDQANQPAYTSTYYPSTINLSLSPNKMSYSSCLSPRKFCHIS